MATDLFTTVFHIDPLAAILMALVAFIALSVGSFASRYLAGDTQYRAFFYRLSGIAASVMVMVSANHLLVLAVGWMASNLLLMRLMHHTPGWRAAEASAKLAGSTFTLGTAVISIALFLLYRATGEMSLQAILNTTSASPLILPALILLLIGAMAQSAIWPFHRWLLSSLNAPTPVSAIMHAGLVNAGGFLLIRFAPLLLQHPILLQAIFVLGITTAILGTLWKLMQSDVKRMLACSTMGQMGFMIAQCGLGLFPAALAHMCWHGLFKAYLFLASGGAAEEKRLDNGYPPSLGIFTLALLCGTTASYTFASTTGMGWFAANTTALIVAIAGMAGTQFALPILHNKPLVALPASAAFGAVYGVSVSTIERLMQPMQLFVPQPLSPLYLAGLAVLVAAWLGMLFLRCPLARAPHLYVAALNASQPHPDTVTADRNSYRYV